MPVPANLVLETSETAGTGAFTLARESGKQRFSEAFPSGGADVFDYYISHHSENEWERGTGSISGNVLSRDTVLENSNGDTSPVNFTAGTKDVTNDVPAGNQVTTDTAQTITGVKTFSAAPSLPADTIDAITEIASGIKSGSDATLVTGTAGTANNVPIWNADGDIVDGGAAIADLQQTDEEIQDVVGAMVTGNTETGLSVTYQDADGTLDFTVTGVLEDLNTLGPNAADSELLVGTGAGALTWESGATLRTSIGLGTGNSPTFTAVSVGSTGLTVGSSVPFSDAAGTLTLQNIDALDATTETTIESAIDTLSNLTTVGALNSGSITSGFGSIDVGSSSIDGGNFSGNHFIASSTNPFLRLDETDAAADEGLWEFDAAGGQFKFHTLNDAITVTNNIFTVDRTGATVDLVDFPGTELSVGGKLSLTADGSAIDAAGSVTFGAGNDASIYFNGTNLEIDTTTGIEFSQNGVNLGDIGSTGMNIVAGDTYQIAGSSVLSATALTLGASGALSASSGNLTVNSGWTAAGQTCANLGTVTTADINGGTVDGAVIGGSSAAAGSFTTLSTSSTLTLGGNITRAASQTIDLTGAATRTLTLQNSTASQVANFDVDGRLLFRNNTGFAFTLSGTPTANRTITFPNTSDTVVTLGATQTLTNKTLTSPTINLANVTSSGDLSVSNGGTGRSSHTAYSVLCGGTTSTAAQQSVASVGSDGQVLMSNGASALPTFESFYPQTSLTFNLIGRYWGAGTTSVPSSWTLTGSGATIAQNTTNAQIQAAEIGVQLTRVGNDCKITQTVSSIAGFDDIDGWQGAEVTFGRWVYATVASRVRIAVFDGSTRTFSSYHTGGSSLEFLTVTATLGGSATEVTIECHVDTGNTSGTFSGGAFIVGKHLPDVAVTPPEWIGAKAVFPLGSIDNTGVSQTASIVLGLNKAAFTVPFKAVARNLYVTSSAAPGAGETYDFTIRKNASTTSVTCQTAGASAQSSNDTTNQVAFAVADTLDILVQTSSGATSANHTVLMQFDEIPL